LADSGGFERGHLAVGGQSAIGTQHRYQDRHRNGESDHPCEVQREEFDYGHHGSPLPAILPSIWKTRLRIKRKIISERLKKKGE